MNTATSRPPARRWPGAAVLRPAAPSPAPPAALPLSRAEEVLDWLAAHGVSARVEPDEAEGGFWVVCNGKAG